MQNAKAFFSSKTMWFGMAQIAFATIGYYTGGLDPQAAFSLLVTGLGTMGFRAVTTQPVQGF
ncbi:MAG: hypothetical protein KGL39_32865 [Patescibacteria group bacterium]|nr:hypothetical protein [Patescibacteria group bacterium]